MAVVTRKLLVSSGEGTISEQLKIAHQKMEQ